MKKYIIVVLIAVLMVAILPSVGSTERLPHFYTPGATDRIDWVLEEGGWGEGEMYSPSGDGYTSGHRQYTYTPFAWEFWSFWTIGTPFSTFTSFWPFRNYDSGTDRIVNGTLIK